MKRLAPCLALVAALMVGAQSRAANPPGALDLPPSNVIPAPVDVTPAAPRAQRPADPSGNPLWAIPLSALTATRERPLFLPSRRAPAPAVAGTPVVVGAAAAAVRRAGAAAAHADRCNRGRHGRICGVPRTGNRHCDPAARPGRIIPGWVLRSVKGPRGDAGEEQAQHDARAAGARQRRIDAVVAGVRRLPR